MTAAEAVVDSYRQQARFCRAETAEVRRPRLLRGLLDTARHIAEIPCGVGHFLTDYVQAAKAVTDRWFHPAQAGGAVLRRRRRQHRDGAQLRIEFDYRNPAGDRLRTTAVELALLSVSNLADAFTTAGFVHLRFLPGHGGLSELLATAPAGGQR